jgi:rhamnosyl/mannosyltransferase
MNNLKVLHIGKYYHPYRGGFEYSLYTLVNELKDKLQIQVLVSHTRCKTVVDKMRNLTIYRLANLGRIFSQPISPLLPLWIKRLKADIIHIHLPNPLAMFSYLITSSDAKLIVSYHNDVVEHWLPMVFFRPLLIRILKRADNIIVTSYNLIESSTVLKRFREKCIVIPHGIDVFRFQLTPQVIKESEKIKQETDKPIILFIGRLVYYKGLKYLIKAMQNIDAQLIIIGDGPLGFRLKTLAKSLGVNNKISWLGNMPDEAIPAYYHACDLSVLPSCSNSESFGLVILEAHACEKPVVSTDLPTGVTFTNLHKETGLVVPSRNPAALSVAINELLSSKELRQVYGQNGRQRVENEFTKEKMAEKVLMLYNMVGNR